MIRLLLVLILLPGVAFAQRYTSISGPKLIEMCGGRDAKQTETCTAYLDGISDAISFYQQAVPANGSRGGKLPAYSCVPQNLTGTRLREQVVEWGRANAAEVAKQNAAGVAVRAITAANKCP